MGRKDGRGAKRAVRATPKLFPEVDEEAIRAKHPDPAQVPWAIKASSRLIDLQVRLNESATGIARIINPAPFGTQLWHTTVLDWATGRGGDVPHLAILMLEAEAIKRGVDLDGWELTDAARAREAAARADEMLRTIAHLDQVLPGEIEGLREELRSLSAQLDALNRQTAPEQAPAVTTPPPAAATDPEEAMTDALAGLEDRLPADRPKHQELPGPPAPPKARARRKHTNPDRTA